MLLMNRKRALRPLGGTDTTPFRRLPNGTPLHLLYLQAAKGDAPHYLRNAYSLTPVRAPHHDKSVTDVRWAAYARNARRGHHRTTC